jgi:hypothetical protein
MDRSDDQKDRVGDVLGLGHIAPDATVPARQVEDSEDARRHRRIQHGADSLVGGPEAPERHPGATDMGAAGEGTDIEE